MPSANMRSLIHLITIFLAQSRLSYSAKCAAPTVVDYTSSVTYIGVSNPGVENFLSIHYGQDTSGQNRFAPPKPHIPFQGSVIHATSPGPACPQPLGPPNIPLSLSNITSISENCLHLNIARPAGTCSGSKLPVMIYIHGGT